MSNRPRNVRCPFCGKFMYLTMKGINDKNVLTRTYGHDCGPAHEQRYVQREFQSADGKHWFYVVGAGSYSDFLGRRHTWTENGKNLSDITKIERWANSVTRAYKLKAVLDDFKSEDGIMLYDEDEKKTMYVSYVNPETGVIFLKHKN